MEGSARFHMERHKHVSLHGNGSLDTKGSLYRNGTSSVEAKDFLFCSRSVARLRT